MNEKDAGSGAPATPASPGEKPEGRDATGSEKQRRTLLEGAVADIFRRGIEAGFERVARGEGKAALRSVLGDLRIPREVAGYVASQLDDTKGAILKVVAREVREFLETSHFGDELARILTTLSFEIRTEVRFVPNEDGKKLRPKVNTRARLRTRRPDEQ